jgi:hypothetical protein
MPKTKCQYMPKTYSKVNILDRRKDGNTDYERELKLEVI